MRLLNTRTKLLDEFADLDVPPYAILSHRWGSKELSFQDFEAGSLPSGPGYRKIVGACRFAGERSHEWIWIDTCCIDKRSSAELSEAINSMFRWYSEAEECFIYMPDVSPFSNGQEKVFKAFESSDWWARGWTLQELLAPKYVTFCTSAWEVIGVKAAEDGEPDLSQKISDITGIPLDVLYDRAEIRFYSAAQRLSWAARRETTRLEDRAYSLLGLLGVNMPLLYGERSKSFLRLLEEVLRVSNDETVFAWYSGTFRIFQQAEIMKSFVLQHYLLLPAHPVAYENCGSMRISPYYGEPRFNFRNGLIKLKIKECDDMLFLEEGIVCIALRCWDTDSKDALSEALQPGSSGPWRRTIYLERRPCDHFARLEFEPALTNVEDLFPREQWQRPSETKTFYIHASTAPCVYGVENMRGASVGL